MGLSETNLIHSGSFYLGGEWTNIKFHDKDSWTNFSNLFRWWKDSPVILVEEKHFEGNVPLFFAKFITHVPKSTLFIAEWCANRLPITYKHYFENYDHCGNENPNCWIFEMIKNNVDIDYFIVLNSSGTTQFDPHIPKFQELPPDRKKAVKVISLIIK